MTTPSTWIAHEIRHQVVSLGVTLALTIAALVLLTLFAALPQEELLAPLQELAMVQLQEDPVIENAKRIMANPLANRMIPDKADVLSDEHSKTLENVNPDELGDPVVPGVNENRPFDNRTLESAENEKNEHLLPYENSQPFLRTRPNKSVLEHITGNRATSTTDVGHLYELSTYRWEHAGYMLKWKNKMTGKWYEITSRIFFNQNAQLGEIIIWVKVARDGRLIDSRVVDFNCDRSFVAPAYASVTNSFPLDPLPEAFPDEFLETTWTIRIVN